MGWESGIRGEQVSFSVETRYAPWLRTDEGRILYLEQYGKRRKRNGIEIGVSCTMLWVYSEKLWIHIIHVSGRFIFLESQRLHLQRPNAFGFSDKQSQQTQTIKHPGWHILLRRSNIIDTRASCSHLGVSARFRWLGRSFHMWLETCLHLFALVCTMNPCLQPSFDVRSKAKDS